MEQIREQSKGKQNQLIVKDVDFNGAKLRAAQDEKGVIWAGVRWMCEGIGLSEDQRKRQIKNIQTDIVLSKGGSNLTLPTPGGVQSVLCLMLDYVPLWLAKISITPKMQKENPDLVERLIQYQLKAKDVLAAAFLPKYNPNQENREPNLKKIEQQLDYLEKMFNRKLGYQSDNIDRLFKMVSDMSKTLPLLEEQKQEREKEFQREIQEKVEEAKRAAEEKAKLEEQDYLSWKKEVYDLATLIAKKSDIYTQNRQVLSVAYMKLRDVYGFVQKQEEKEFKEKYLTERTPYTIELVWNNKKYRPMLLPILKDMNESIPQLTQEEKVEVMIEDLGNFYNDMSKHYCATCHKIIATIEKKTKVDWSLRETRYKNKYNKKGKIAKKKLIAESDCLFKIFKECVTEMKEAVKAK